MPPSGLASTLALVVLAVALFVGAMPWLVRPVLRAVFGVRYRVRIVGADHLPRVGPALIVSNHVSWIDGFLVVAALPRRMRVLVNAAYVDYPLIRFLARRVGIIPVRYGRPHALRAALRTAQEVLDRGGGVLIFPEAQLTRHGFPGTFHRGVNVLLDGRDHVPVVPLGLEGLWGSVFSFAAPRGSWLRRLFGPRHVVTLALGPSVPPPRTVFAIRQAVVEAGVAARDDRPGLPPPATIDPSLPSWNHPTLGPLTASTPDHHRGDIHQTGHKPGTVGQAIPGVALRVVDDGGATLPPDVPGRLQARVAGRPGWIDTDRRGSLDRDGFVTLFDQDAPRTASGGTD